MARRFQTDAEFMRDKRRRASTPTYLVAKCGCAPRCYVVLRVIDDRPAATCARFDSEREASDYIRGLGSLHGDAA